MSEKLIKKYLANISRDDPLRDEFIKIIIPSLKNPKVISNIDRRPKWLCIYCNKTASSSNENESSFISFTTCYAYIRHLFEKHTSNLPCNGNVFGLDRQKDIYKCDKCKKTFTRKEHYMQHMKSKSHMNNVEMNDNSNKSLTKNEPRVDVEPNVDDEPNVDVDEQNKIGNLDVIKKKQDDLGIRRFLFKKYAYYETNNNDEAINENKAINVASNFLVEENTNRNSSDSEDEDRLLIEWINSNLEFLEDCNRRCTKPILKRKRSEDNASSSTKRVHFNDNE